MYQFFFVFPYVFFSSYSKKSLSWMWSLRLIWKQNWSSGIAHCRRGPRKARRRRRPSSTSLASWSSSISTHCCGTCFPPFLFDFFLLPSFPKIGLQSYQPVCVCVCVCVSVCVCVCLWVCYVCLKYYWFQFPNFMWWILLSFSGYFQAIIF